MIQRYNNIWSYAVISFIVFGAFIYTLGLIIASTVDSSGIYWMYIGISISLTVVAISFKFYKKPFITAASSMGCFIFVAWNLTRYPLLDNMQLAQQDLKNLGGQGPLLVGDFPTLIFINTVSIIIFLAIGVIESIFTIHLYKKYGKEWKHARYGQESKTKEIESKNEDMKFIIEPSKFKYCPKCLFQEKIESLENKCPNCHIEFKIPESNTSLSL